MSQYLVNRDVVLALAGEFRRIKRHRVGDIDQPVFLQHVHQQRGDAL